MSIFAADGLSVNFGGVRAVDGVSFAVERGEVFSIIGPNGAGKTTIFNLISRMYDASAGRILFESQDVTDLPAHRIASRGIARTFQNIELFPQATLLQNLLIGRHSHVKTGVLSQLCFLPSTYRAEVEHREEVEDVISFLRLERYRDEMVGSLSYGVRKVVELGRALCVKPKLLLLDEPSSGLNVEETEEMAFWIEDVRDDLGVTVIMIEHDLKLVQAVSDRVMVLNYGRVLAIGTANDVQRDPDVIQAYIGGTS